MTISPIPADLDLEAALTGEGEEGDEEGGGEEDEQTAFAGPFSPDQDGTVVFDQALEAGRYALICFQPDRDDPDRAPHFTKGMFADFTIK